MRIVVLGAGTVGTSTAELLCKNRHSVTVVDSNPEKIARLNEQLDVRAITGSACEASVLFQADVLGCDICLALTGLDEVNLVAASIAKAMGAQRTMARVFAPVLHDRSTFDYQQHFKIDRLLSLEHLSAMEFARAIRSPGALTVENLARGEVEMREFILEEQSKILDNELKNLKLPTGVRIASVVREGKTWIAGANDILRNGDRITVIGNRDKIDEVSRMIQKKLPPRRMIVIAGGGETGYHLAHALSWSRFSVVLLERDRERCEFLANRLKHATVVEADATRHQRLQEERVGQADVFVACFGDDEDGIMASVEASELGAKQVMTIINRPDYANVVGKLGIHVPVSPREVMAKEVLNFLTKGAVVSRHRLAGSSILVLELDVRKDSPITEHVLAEAELPDQCLIAAACNADQVRVPGGNDQLRANESVIALVDKSVEKDLARLFEASSG